MADGTAKTAKGVGIVVVVVGLAFLGMLAYLAWSYFDIRSSPAYSMAEIGDMPRPEIGRIFGALEHVEVLGGHVRAIEASCLPHSGGGCTEAFAVAIVSGGSAMGITCFVSSEAALGGLRPGDSAPFIGRFIEARSDGPLFYPCWFEGSSIYG
ncbi:MAG: hypothetical protein OXO50_00395 [Caldilineaceae bacterium]|nr:hypothetical protein [Caldilineaceae bacterium]